jgi:hypothetical protein
MEGPCTVFDTEDDGGDVDDDDDGCGVEAVDIAVEIGTSGWSISAGLAAASGSVTFNNFNYNNWMQV